VAEDHLGLTFIGCQMFGLLNRKKINLRALVAGHRVLKETKVHLKTGIKVKVKIPENATDTCPWNTFANWVSDTNRKYGGKIVSLTTKHRDNAVCKDGWKFKLPHRRTDEGWVPDGWLVEIEQDDQGKIKCDCSWAPCVERQSTTKA
jgi:hypothetical protein